MKVLNLYAGIGGNRKLWEDVEVTAVEIDPDIAKIYQDYFPNDTVIVGDAHEILLSLAKSGELNNYGFVWGSPPCKKNSRINKNFGLIRYADLRLYQEVILLENWFKGKYCIENVISYYQPLIPAKVIDRHYYWTNFYIRETSRKNPPKEINMIAQKTKKKRRYGGFYHRGDIAEIKTRIDRFGFDLSGYKLNGRKDQVLRNCVNPETGLYILNCARNILTKQNEKQIDLFEK